jgi:hypothetical protein
VPRVLGRSGARRMGSRWDGTKDVITRKGGSRDSTQKAIAKQPREELAVLAQVVFAMQEHHARETRVRLALPVRCSALRRQRATGRKGTSTNRRAAPGPYVRA